MPDASHSDAMSMAQAVIDSKCGGEPEVLTEEERAERIAALDELHRLDETIRRSGAALQHETTEAVMLTKEGARD